ncbi:MAG: DUF4469 domain-containing protein [Bacteroidales bacterium]|jgi:hypothetical protein|nr:DUF4469 domain-containing protein [Bacteroidales bacterium]
MYEECVKVSQGRHFPGNTKHNIDVAKAIREEGSDLQEETLVDVLNRGDRWRRRFLLEGSSVQDGNVHLSPRVKGNWFGAVPQYDPAEHQITIDATPTAEWRKALEEEVGVEVLGKKTDGGAVIGMLTNVATGKTDGVISPCGSAVIEGEQIKIATAGEAGLGVFFVAADGTKKASIFGLAENTPKKIICTIPQLDPGSYTLQIVTRYTGGNQLLKVPRTITYELPLTVKGNETKG